MIIFGSVRFLSKKVTKPKFFFLKKKPKPNRNRVKPTGFGSVRFGVFRAKTGLARFFRFWLGFGSVFSGFGSVFSVWLGFGSIFPVWLGFFSDFLLVSVRFGSVFLVFCYKTGTEPAGFFKNLIGLIGFFFSVRFFRLFFFRFSRFNWFSGFFAHP